MQLVWLLSHAWASATGRGVGLPCSLEWECRISGLRMGSIIRWVVFHTSRASVINFHPNYSFEVGKTSVQTPLEWYKDDRQRPSSFLRNWYDFFRTPWSHWLGGTEGDVTNMKELMKGKVNFRLALQLSSGGGLRNFWKVVSFRNTVFFLFWLTAFTTSDCGFDENGPFSYSVNCCKNGNNSDFDGETVSRLPLFLGLLKSTLTQIRPFKLARLPSKLPLSGTRTTDRDLPVSCKTGMTSFEHLDLIDWEVPKETLQTWRN